jgi:anti-anti-sigma regulatory factor
MAIFGKPPTRKTEKAKSGEAGAAREPQVLSARELAAQAASRKGKLPGLEPLGETSLRGASIIDWSTAPKAIEVAQANPGLCAVLENAALLFANGQDAAARELLEQGVSTDQDTKLSPLAWLALFDLLQRANDRVAFDQLSMQYVLQFERSAPAWEEPRKSAAGEAQGGGGGYIAITGKLSSQSRAQLEGLKRALEKCVPRARIDLASVTGFDDDGAKLLAADLARARNQRMELAIQRPEKLRAALEEAVAKGREGGEGAWLLSLELMQWGHEQAAFDERAVEFAVTFELSPPSWEPPPRAPGTKRDVIPDENAAAATALVPADKDMVFFEGVLGGAAPPALARLTDFASRNPVVPINMTEVERIDFVCAGALLNTITRIEAQGKAVQIAGASPIVRALLLLIGISPRHFVKKTG